MNYVSFVEQVRNLLGLRKASSEGNFDEFLSTVSGVVHVGANTGQERTRYADARLPTIWVEPIPDIFDRLRYNIQSYPDQKALNALVTNIDAQSYDFHIANNDGASSSILPLKQHDQIWPDVGYVGTIPLESVTLPTLLKREGIHLPRHQALVLDTQGTELLVLRGALPILDRFDYIMVEAPDFESYEGCCQREDIHTFMTQNGFEEVGCRTFAKVKDVGGYYDLLYRRRNLEARRTSRGHEAKRRDGWSGGLRRLRRSLLPPTAKDHARRTGAILGRIDKLEKNLQQLLPPSSSSLSSRTSDQGQVLRILRLIRPYSPLTHTKVRLGSLNDGGYVLLDDFRPLVAALSLGVGDNDSWDLAMAERGIPVHQFDHTIDSAPSTHPLLVFHRKEIRATPGTGCATLPELIGEHAKGADPDLLLKMDIEGAEWEVLKACPQELLAHFTQIVCEFHDLHRLSEASFRELVGQVFEKLSKSFAVVHIHGNNANPFYGVANVPVPNLLELTFANRALYPTSDELELFPTRLDMPNIPGRPDMHLGAFRH